MKMVYPNYEVQTHGSDPNNADSDEDGLTDGDEVSTHGTDPLESDFDHDGYDDPTEIDAGTNPTDAADFPIEEDKDAPVQDKHH